MPDGGGVRNAGWFAKALTPMTGIYREKKAQKRTEGEALCGKVTPLFSDGNNRLFFIKIIAKGSKPRELTTGTKAAAATTTTTTMFAKRFQLGLHAQRSVTREPCSSKIRRRRKARGLKNDQGE